MLVAEILIETYNEKGQLSQRLKQKSRSFLKQFIQLIEVQTNQATKTLTDITGTDRSVDTQSENFFCTHGGGHGWARADYRHVQVENLGIVVGSGTTAVTPTDTKLETKIAHGKSAGQLLYLGNALYPITINEVGIYALGSQYYYGFCICRDVLTSAVTVANGELLKVRYRIKVSTS